MNTSFDYRINKKHGRPVFDLKDMLAVVEAVENEALASEVVADSDVQKAVKSPLKVTQTVNRPLITKSCAMSSLPTISDELRKRWSQSLNTVRRPNHENTKVYPKIIEELDELYQQRTKKLHDRIKQVREGYENEAKKRTAAMAERRKQEAEAQVQLEAQQASKLITLQKAAEEEAKRAELARQEQARLDNLAKQKAAEEKRIEEEREAKIKAEVKVYEEVKEKNTPKPEVSEQPTPSTKTVEEQNSKDSRLDVFLKPDTISSVIEHVKSNCQVLLKPSSTEDKEIAMKIKRAVAVPVGALTQRSGEDLKTQIKRLVSILKLQDIPSHPCASDFVTHEIAFRLVKLAEDQLSSNEKASPAIAVAIVALWIESATFGELFMAHLFQTCPILMPDSFNFSQDIDEQRFKQMSGMCRLFASLASSDCPPGTEKHPFGIENIWKFVVGIIIVPNVSELSTQALYEVLVFSGKQMHTLYKDQFIKLVKLIATSFLPRAVGGAATRLKIFLEEADTQGFKDPPGMLQAGFWGSKDMYTGKVAGD